MLKTLESIESKTQPDESGVGVGGSRAGCGGSKLDRSRNNNNEVDGDEVEDDEVVTKVQKLFKFKNLSKSKKAVGSDFFTPGARLAFTKLRQAFLKAPILYYFDPERHIRIETDALGYAISGVLSQLILDNLGQ